MSERSFIARGAASFRVDFDGPPRDFYFLLLPRLTMLAFSSAVEPLRVANQVANRELYRWFMMTEDGAPVRCSNGILITPDSGLRNLPKSAAAFVCSGTEPSDSVSPKAVAWVSRQRAFGCQVGGICTGAFVLAKAGLLDRRVFTLHWENQPAFTESFVGLEPTGNLFENDNGLMTCGGGSAATDMMLAQIEQDHGKDLAVVVADMCIHHRSDSRKAPQKSAYSVALSSRNPHLIAAMQYMDDNLENPVEIDAVADEINISRRQLERLFKRHVGVSPAQFYIEQRVSRAHALLNETAMSVNEIAVATGFSSSSQLSLRFRKRFGLSPGAFRTRWAQVK